MNVVTSKINLNLPKIKLLDKSVSKALEMTLDALHTEVVEAQVMPFDTGTMQNNSTFGDYSKSSSGTVKLVTSTPYARRMYFHPEYNFQTKENSNAQGEWYEQWINGKSKKFCQNTFARLYKREAGL